MARITLRRLNEALWNSGHPSTDLKFARIAFAAIKAGLDERAALLIAAKAFDAAKLYVWKFENDYAMHSHLERISAAQHPNGKCAEDIAARREGRPSRWGTAEFHAAARA